MPSAFAPSRLDRQQGPPRHPRHSDFTPVGERAGPEAPRARLLLPVRVLVEADCEDARRRHGCSDHPRLLWCPSRGQYDTKKRLDHWLVPDSQNNCFLLLLVLKRKSDKVWRDVKEEWSSMITLKKKRFWAIRIFLLSSTRLASGSAGKRASSCVTRTPGCSSCERSSLPSRTRAATTGTTSELSSHYFDCYSSKVYPVATDGSWPSSLSVDRMNILPRNVPVQHWNGFHADDTHFAFMLGYWVVFVADQFSVEKGGNNSWSRILCGCIEDPLRI